jgi:hypothetical protein
MADEGLKKAREEMEAIEEVAPLPPIFDPANNDLTTIKEIETAIDEYRRKFASAQIMAKQGLLPEGFVRQFDEDMNAVGNLILSSGEATDEMAAAFAEMAENAGFFRNENESMEHFITRVAEGAVEAKDEWGAFFDSMIDGIGKAIGDLIVKGKGFKEVMGGIMRGFSGAGIITGLKTITGTLRTAMADGKSFTDGLSEGIGKFREQLDGKVNAGILGVSAAMGGWQDIGMAGLSAISNFAKGDWVAGIMASVGAVVGAFKKLFGGTTAEKELKKMGLTISEELTKKIEEANKALGDYGAAIRTNLAGIMQEEGVKSIKDFNKFLGMNRALLSDLDRGTLSSSEAMKSMGESMTELIKAAVDLNSPAAFGGVITNLIDVIARTQLTGTSMIAASDATKLLGEQFPALVEASKEFGLAGKAGLRQIIDGAREAGLAVAEIDSFVREKAGTIVSSIQKLVGSGLELTATQIQFAARNMSVAFAEMRAAGMSVPEIINAMGDSLGAITERAAELGIKLPESFSLIAGLGPLFQNEFVKPQLEGLGAITSAFGALIELGLKPTQEDFQALTETAFTAFTTMQEQGASGKQALLAIGPTLAMIRDNAIQFGFAIDANTQSLIDQAVEAGVLGEAQMSTNEVMQTGFENVGNAINRLIETMGGVPIALKGFEKSVVSAGNTMNNEFTQTGQVLNGVVVPGINAAAGAIQNLGGLASEQMALFKDSAGDAVNGAIEDFEFLQKKLVGNTIIKDIATMGSAFMEQWGDNTADVVMKVGTDFQGLKDETVGTPGVPGSGVMNQIKTGILTRPALPNAPTMTPQMQEQMKLKKAIQAKEAMKINMRVDIGGREVKNLIVETVAEESRDGRMVVDTNSVRETGR